MRWVKHPANSHNAEIMAEVIDRGGHHAYGLYWLLVEMCADGNGTVTRKRGDWCADLRTWRLDRSLSPLVMTGLVTTRTKGSDLTISVTGITYYDRPGPQEWVAIRAEVFERDNYTCQYCGVHGVKLECDHVIPVCKGGSSFAENLATACYACNRSKGGKTVEEWRS